MASTINNVREFVIDSLKKYHEHLVTAQAAATEITLADYAPLTSYTSLETEVGKLQGKVDGLENTGGQPNVIETVKVDGTALTVTNKAVDIDLSGKVDKVAGKQLSTEDFTTAYMTKLGGIEDGAQVNKIETITVDNAATTISNKSVNIDLSAYPNAATWDSTNHQIVFKHGETQLFTVDGADFIKDGMIDAISITTGTGTNAGKNVLKIDFNTDAESTNHTDIEIPLDNIFNPDNYYNKTTADDTFVKKVDEKKLSLAGNTPAAAGTNKANVISSVAVNDHQITASYTAVLTTETQLSLGAKSGSGNVITELEVSNHQITASYGITALTEATQAEISVSGNAPTAATNRTAVITGVSTSGTKNHALTLTYANVVTNETQLSLSGTRPADGTDTTSVATGFEVSDHQITVTYTAVLKSHQDISGKEDKSNKTDTIIGNEASSTYYVSTKAVATYVGSLAELTQSELNDIFGLTTTP